MAKRSKKKDFVQINFRNVKLSPESRKRCRKVKDHLWGNVANAIECGEWWFPAKNHNYTHMKKEFEVQTKDFFNLDFDITISDFNTDIICYDDR